MIQDVHRKSGAQEDNHELLFFKRYATKGRRWWETNLWHCQGWFEADDWHWQELDIYCQMSCIHLRSDSPIWVLVWLHLNLEGQLSSGGEYKHSGATPLCSWTVGPERKCYTITRITVMCKCGLWGIICIYDDFMGVHSVSINVRFLSIYVYECRQEECQSLPSAGLE